MAKMRIQKALGEAGVASRRAVEQMILDGRITVNRELVAKLPCFVDLACDEVRVDSVRVRAPRGRKIYYLLNKPRGVVCTQRDPQGRPRAVDLLGGKANKRVYCVGRLDVESTGLIILTNDGELTQRLTHPSFSVTKTYVVEVDGRLTGEQIAQLKAGVYIDGKRTRGTSAKVLRSSPKRSLLEIRLREGRNREIRRVLARLGHKVRKLKRVAIGPVTDRGVKVGGFRMLTGAEVRRLSRAGGRPKRPPAGERAKAAAPGEAKRNCT